MKSIIDTFQTDLAIAAWRAAEAILAKYGDDAEFFIKNSVGHGIDATAADHLTYLVQTLREEASQPRDLWQEALLNS